MQSQIESRLRIFPDPAFRPSIGYAAIRHGAADARVYIGKLYVLAAHRNSGAGRKTLELLERMARERGATHLWLTVNKGNPSVRMYERLGFTIVDAMVVDIGGAT